MFSQASGWTALRKTIKDSLNWESFEQQALWTIIQVYIKASNRIDSTKMFQAHKGIRIENWIPMLPLIDSLNHPEAMSAIWRMLLNSDPNLATMRMLLARDKDEIVTNILFNWASHPENKKKMIDPLVNCMTRVSTNFV